MSSLDALAEAKAKLAAARQLSQLRFRVTATGYLFAAELTIEPAQAAARVIGPLAELLNEWGPAMLERLCERLEHQVAERTAEAVGECRRFLRSVDLGVDGPLRVALTVTPGLAGQPTEDGQ